MHKCKTNNKCNLWEMNWWMHQTRSNTTSKSQCSKSKCRWTCCTQGIGHTKWHHKSCSNNGQWIFTMVATTNLFKILMKLSQHNNHGNLQPLVISCTQNKCINTNNKFIGLQDLEPNPNINLVIANSKMEWIQLTNQLEQLCHINQRPCNQLISMPYLETGWTSNNTNYYSTRANIPTCHLANQNGF
jgi:hypothetical protein